MKIFPILRGYRLDEKIAGLRQHGVQMIVIALPWRMIEPHENQARRNHAQSLETLAGRGGLSTCEAVAVLQDRPWRKMPSQEAEWALVKLLEEYSESA